MAGDKRIEITIPGDLYEDLSKFAELYGDTIEHLIVTAIHRFVADEEEAGALTSDDERDQLDALLKPALDELDRGEFIPHEEIVREIKERFRRAA